MLLPNAKYDEHKPKLDWMPDWQDANAYPADPAELTSEQWAWEFIRRNESYQQAYEVGVRYTKRWLNKNTDVKGFKEYFDCKPVARQQDTLSEYLKRCADKGIDKPDIQPKTPDILSAFPFSKFSQKLNPGNNQHPDFDKYHYPKLYTFEEKTDLISEYDMENNDEIVMIFTLHLPIKQQINEAKNKLYELQNDYQKNVGDLKARMRYQPEYFSNYLRYLDADYCGISQTEMAAVIHKHLEGASQRVNRGLKAAIRLRDDGFWGILKNDLLAEID